MNPEKQRIEREGEKSMKIVESFLTKNDCYKGGRTITPKGLMLHSVGVGQPDAAVFLRNWNKSGLTKCVHGVISAKDGTIYQTLPWNRRGWHGGGSSNNTHIGVEMCEPSQIQYTGGASFKVKGNTPAEIAANKEKAIAAAMITYNAAVELYAMLCKQYKLDPMKDICSHAEGYKKKIASNHGDPDHIWRQLGMSVSMDTFRAAVKAEMEKSGSGVAETPSITVVETSKPSTSLSKKFHVSIPNLRIRKGPGSSYAATGAYTGVGVFTVTEIQNGSGSSKGWGKLKSGAGWFSLDYATEV